MQKASTLPLPCWNQMTSMGICFPTCLKAARGLLDQIQTVRACSEEAKISRIYVSGWSNLLATRFQQELHLQKNKILGRERVRILSLESPPLPPFYQSIHHPTYSTYF